ncbi:PSD1 and planctomycete cytochrome C domain-containing protein [Verrucomicrobiales bacterium BCK34]|nr:PSD1 and planctomycete cytochrome C domain-containing protein [Verrucomicrobiales bacterium BCK34]
MASSKNGAVLAILGAGLLYTGLAPVSAEVDFARDIRPILNAKCTGCHGGVKQAGGISFVYKNQVIGFEGESGNPVVVPGEPEKSEMFYRITTDDEDDAMPPREDHPEGLSDGEKELIKNWITEGAGWSGHWSFEPPVMPEIPAVKDSGKAKTSIDRFVVSKLEEENLKPSSRAQPGRLLRRLSLDLTGLPPTLEELASFETAFEKSPEEAIKQAIDELMSRPAFGEKWATMWLDLVRYADSRGLGLDDRRTIWPYRDWVINAFNEDMPFDQFTIRQLAGDLLPEPTINDLIATAAHRNTQTNNEGGTDDEEFRVEAIVDRVNTTWQTWGSITFGCTQCHDHPYEAFRNEEYYEFMAFFNNTADSDLQKDEPLLRVPSDRSQDQRAAELDRTIAESQKQIWKKGRAIADKTTWAATENLEVSTNNQTRYVVEKSGEREQFTTQGTVERGPLLTVLSSIPGTTKAITAIRLTIQPKNAEKALKDSEWGFGIDKLQADMIAEDGTERPILFELSVADIPAMPHDPLIEVKPDGTGFSAQTRIHHQREIILVPASPIPVNSDQLRLQITSKGFAHGAFPLVIQRGHIDVTGDSDWTALAKDSEHKAARKALQTTIAERKKIPSVNIPMTSERPAQLARPTHVFGGGNFLEKEARVTTGFPESLPSPEGELPDRLAMAQWWVSPDHPLTSRVFVNRIWERLFGTGIVATLEDFGSSGEDPSHPELLDYLALRFQNDYAWSMKSIIREIVSSATYQQSAKTTPDALERDSANRLLSRGPRTRLSAEVIRDQALALSGLITDEVGGEPVHPPIPAGVWKPFSSGDKWTTPKSGDKNRYRRAIYTYAKRSIPYPAFATFDAPSREFCTPRRLTSNTPLQALTMLNDEAFAEAAAGLARRMKYDTEGDVTAKLANGYRITTSRDPSPEKLQELVSLYTNLEAQYASQPDLKKGLAGTSDGAAFTVVAQILLNLDEVLSK